GHKYKPLFPMISLTHWVVDELHVILRITDRLWLLLVSEIDVKTNSRIRNIISQEMLRIHVHFNWWEDQNTKMWTSTSLTGVDKLKVLQNFNLDLLFLNKSRAQLIRRLWNGFNELYEDMHKQRINGVEFKKKALEWINLFLTPSSGNPNHPQTFIKGLYRPYDITPYIHTLVYHIPEFLNLHSNF
ncbi:43433_t:CDS:2, partial [Gigaspora margarita]